MLSEKQIGAIRKRQQAARDEVSALCNGKRQWTMCIPPDFEHDSDLVLCRALDDVDLLLAELAGSREVVDVTTADEGVERGQNE